MYMYLAPVLELAPFLPQLSSLLSWPALQTSYLGVFHQTHSCIKEASSYKLFKLLAHLVACTTVVQHGRVMGGSSQVFVCSLICVSEQPMSVTLESYLPSPYCTRQLLCKPLYSSLTLVWCHVLPFEWSDRKTPLGGWKAFSGRILCLYMHKLVHSHNVHTICVGTYEVFMHS